MLARVFADASLSESDRDGVVFLAVESQLMMRGACAF